MSIYENLRKLNIEIPKPPDPVGAYVATKKPQIYCLYPVKYRLTLMEILQKEN